MDIARPSHHMAGETSETELPVGFCALQLTNIDNIIYGYKWEYIYIYSIRTRLETWDHPRNRTAIVESSHFWHRLTMYDTRQSYIRWYTCTHAIVTCSDTYRRNERTWRDPRPAAILDNHNSTIIILILSLYMYTNSVAKIDNHVICDTHNVIIIIQQQQRHRYSYFVYIASAPGHRASSVCGAACWHRTNKTQKCKTYLQQYTQ